MYLSVGGFWPHKRMNELSEEFQKANIDNCTLVLMGYDTRFGQPPMRSKNIRIFVGADQQTIFNAMRESDLYILNSDNEGYGLVLLESMLNGCEWIGRDIAAAHDLHTYYALGNTYKTKEELQILLKSFLKNENAIKAGKSFVTTTHNAERSVICLEQCL
jgi:glycosyltransferase involved in cell wall biosynthesis